jgi:hypothetical protein
VVVVIGEVLVDELESVGSLGFSLPSPAYLVGAILFGLIGFAAYRFGNKSARPAVKWAGVTLMLYPYAISETWLMYAVGVGLCAAMVWFRDLGA